MKIGRTLQKIKQKFVCRAFARSGLTVKVVPKQECTIDLDDPTLVRVRLLPGNLSALDFCDITEHPNFDHMTLEEEGSIVFGFRDMTANQVACEFEPWGWEFVDLMELQLVSDEDLNATTEEPPAV